MSKWFDMHSSSNDCRVDIGYNDRVFLYILRKTAKEWDRVLRKMCDCCHISRWWKHLWA